MRLVPTAEYGSLTPEAVSPLVVHIPAECPKQREAALNEEAFETAANHVGGCLRGVLYAVLFQTVVVFLCVVLFKIWRMMR